MPVSARLSVLVVAALAVVPAVWAQGSPGREPSAPLKPLTEQQRKEREALKLYALGLECEHEDRLLEAQKAFEEAARLNPKAAPVFKALVPVYLALDRGADALAAARKVLDLDPSDHETWYLYARQLRAAGRTRDAIAALRKGVACEGLGDRPELALPMYQDLGLLCESARDYAGAAAALGEAAKLLDHPEGLLEVADLDRDEARRRAAETYEHIGRLRLQAHQRARAAAAFRRAQAAYPAGAGRLAYNLAQVYAEDGKSAQALAQLDAYLRLLPQAREPYEMKIALLTKLGRKAEVVPWLERAAAVDRHNVGLRLLLGQQCAMAGQTARADQVYRELADEAPSAALYRGLFRLYAGADGPGWGPAKALALLDRTVEQARKQDKGPAGGPAPAQARAMLAALRDDPALGTILLRAAVARANAAPRLQHETLRLLAVLADRGKQLDAAERFYREALQGVRPDTEAAVYGGLLRVLWKAHKYDAIVAVCRQGLKASQATNHVLFHSDLARALARLGKADEAVAEADQAVRLAAGPERLPLRTLRVRVLVETGRLDRAEAECLALLKEGPDPGDALEVRYLLSGVYSAAGDYPKAEEQLQWMLKADAGNATACNDLGYLWADRGKNLEEAEKLIRKALELDREQRKVRAPGREGGPDADPGPDNAAYVDSLGWVLFRRGRPEAALKELQRAVALPDGDDPVVWDHLGDVHYRLRQAKEARSAWQQARRLYEREHRLDRDQHYRDLRQKLRLLDAETSR
jgi:tetratricopeptide (TPR) repeat protein